MSSEATKLQADLLGAFHEYGVDLSSRTIYLGTDKGNEDSDQGVMAAEFIKNMHALHLLSNDPVTVLMNNPGGDVQDGMAIYDTIACSECPVTIVVRGRASSMGSIILQAAHERVMGPNSSQLIHYGCFSVDAHAKTAAKQLEESERFDLWMEQLYLGKIREKIPGFTLAKLRNMLDHDSFLTAQGSVDIGLADSIG